MKYRIRIDCTPRVHELLSGNDFLIRTLYANDKEELVQVQVSFDIDGELIDGVIIFSVRRKWDEFFKHHDFAQKVVFVRMSSSYYDEVFCNKEHLKLNYNAVFNED